MHPAMNHFLLALSFLTVHLWASMAQTTTATANNVSSSPPAQTPTYVTPSNVWASMAHTTTITVKNISSSPPAQTPTYLTPSNASSSPPAQTPTYLTPSNASSSPQAHRPTYVTPNNAGSSPPGQTPTYVTPNNASSSPSAQTPTLIPNNTNSSPLAQTPDNPPPVTPRKRTNLAAIIAGSNAGIILIILLIVIIMFSGKKRMEEADKNFNLVPGMPMKFSHEDLRVATEDFKERLGRGGFGSVFKGTLADGTKVAVKRLDNVGQGVNEFLAEVETIGSIHHINLVRLIGFCAEKEHRLLVYEYMSNGSLDNWIFNRNQYPILSWQTRKKIILDIAKGLAYLHEECRQRIVHLDIKPQNILVDDNFNAKVSDFGLSLLIDRDQSQVLVNMRGTPGYLAPEWRRLRITVKADIYSFGIVVLEIVCGRKNFDRSRAESSAHLLGMLEQKAAEDRLIDIVDATSEDVLLHGEEAIQMIRTAAWCLQNDHTKRPNMSDVVKVLEGVMQVEPNISYQFSNAVAPPMEGIVLAPSEPPEASILSAPR